MILSFRLDREDTLHLEVGTTNLGQLAALCQLSAANSATPHLLVSRPDGVLVLFFYYFLSSQLLLLLLVLCVVLGQARDMPSVVHLQQGAIDFVAMTIAAAAASIAPLKELQHNNPDPRVSTAPMYILLVTSTLSCILGQSGTAVLLCTRPWFQGGTGTSSQVRCRLALCPCLGGFRAARSCPLPLPARLHYCKGRWVLLS